VPSAPHIRAELRDPAERLSADDQATQREAEFLERALLRHRLQAEGGQRSISGVVQGVCTNCGEPCLPLAVYCDDECRADHEHRVRVGG
jgi:hypothetical protein